MSQSLMNFYFQFCFISDFFFQRCFEKWVPENSIFMSSNFRVLGRLFSLIINRLLHNWELFYRQPNQIVNYSHLSILNLFIFSSEYWQINYDYLGLSQDVCRRSRASLLVILNQSDHGFKARGLILDVALLGACSPEDYPDLTMMWGAGWVAWPLASGSTQRTLGYQRLNWGQLHASFMLWPLY